MDPLSNLQQHVDSGLDVCPLANVIARSPDAIVILDNNETITTWNDGAEKIFHYQKEEIIGKSFSVLVPRALMESGEPDWINKMVREKGFIKDYITRRITKGGDERVIDLTQALLEEGGVVIGSVAHLRDITERKRNENRLKRKINQFSIIDEINKILHSTTDLNQTLRIILVGVTAGQGLRFNRAFLILVDEDEECLKGRLAIGPSNPDEASRIWTELNEQNPSLLEMLNSYDRSVEIQDVAVNKLVKKISVPLKNKSSLLVRSLVDREMLFVEEGDFLEEDKDLARLLGTSSFVIIPLYSRERNIGILLVDNHITKEKIDREETELLDIFAGQASIAIENSRLYKNLEEKLDALKEANEALRENQEKLLQQERLSIIGEMAAKVAHELRNPLVSIGGFARNLLKNKNENDPDMPYLKIIAEEVSKLEEIIREVLDYSRPLTPKFAEIDLNEILKETFDFCGEEIEKRNIEIETSSTFRPPPIQGDRMQLRQVFLNIIRNALQAMPDGGKIVLSMAKRDESVSVSISDSGIGIPPDDQKKIFHPFFTTKTGGTGLGLTIAFQIIENHGGKLSFEAKNGGGTTFIINLPMKGNGGENGKDTHSGR